MNTSKNHILLVGTGPMAIEHAKVLQAMKIPLTVIGRGQESAVKFKDAIGIEPATGGIKKWLADHKNQPLTQAVVAVSENELGNTTLDLLQNGFSKILVEKPGGLDIGQIAEVSKMAKKTEASVYVGYNRRWYASVKKAHEFIDEDGGVISFNFEFTEWSHVITPLQKAPGVKEQWFLHNSTHVIDLAFYLCGFPSHMTSYVKGSLPWHPRASIFSGAGISEIGALFSYQANWEAPGRWGVEILTPKRRLILRPMESLQVQSIGSVKIEPVEIDDKLDTSYKPGLYRQMESFLSDHPVLCTIHEQAEHSHFFENFLTNKSF